MKQTQEMFLYSSIIYHGPRRNGSNPPFLVQDVTEGKFTMSDCDSGFVHLKKERGMRVRFERKIANKLVNLHPWIKTGIG